MRQKDIKELETYLAKYKEYNQKIHTCGDRSSYSKTDNDATFMRMKEDHLGTGQLKPGYNIQHGVDSEYITWVDTNQKTNDTQALIPFLQDMESHLSFRYRDIVADAGYESEENYLFIEENGQTAYIKPSNYERSKKARYRNDIGRAENMIYDEEENCYVCHNGKKLEWRCDTERTSKTGYTRVTSIYECKECKGCPCKTDCIHGNHCKTPMEERKKTLHVQKTLNAKKEGMRGEDHQ